MLMLFPKMTKFSFFKKLPGLSITLILQIRFSKILLAFQDSLKVSVTEIILSFEIS